MSNFNAPEDRFMPAKNAAGRRAFISTLSKAAGATALLPVPMLNFAGRIRGDKSWTVGQIMDLFIKEVPGAPLENTVDTLKAGTREQIVTGIVTTMFATLEVIQKTIDLGANFIIAHEPSFYNHLDETDWLKNDQVYLYKADLLKKHHIAIWRNHDYVHRHVPDGVRTGVLSQLNWEKFYNSKTSNLVLIPSIPLEGLIRYVKEKLKIPTVRYIGDRSQPCHKILLMPGAAGGKRQIEAISAEKPDVLLCGEVQEWETAEYVRDAHTKGQQLSLVVLGHVSSEEPGSAFMASWLAEKMPEMKVTHIPANNPLSYM